MFSNFPQVFCLMFFKDFFTETLTYVLISRLWSLFVNFSLPAFIYSSTVLLSLLYLHLKAVFKTIELIFFQSISSLTSISCLILTSCLILISSSSSISFFILTTSSPPFSCLIITCKNSFSCFTLFS